MRTVQRKFQVTSKKEFKTKSNFTWKIELISESGFGRVKTKATTHKDMKVTFFNGAVAFQCLAYAPFVDLFLAEEKNQRQPEDVYEVELVLAHLLQLFLGPSISDRSLSISILW